MLFPIGPFCPYPGCLYLTASEDDLQSHYSCHLGPMPASPTDPGERLVDNPPDAELLHIEHIIRDLGNQPYDLDKPLVIYASLSLIRKFYQAGRDGLSTNEGDLLLAPGHSTEDQRRLAKAFVGFIVLTLHGLKIRIDSIDYDSRMRWLELRLENGATAAAPGDSPWAWLLSVTDLQSSSCTCICCVMKDISPAVDSRHLDYTNCIRESYFTSGLYRCESHGCSHKSKRWADFQRHVSSSHCSNPALYPCTFPGCQRGGGNGFPRKDKLKSHFENVHRGRGIPPRRPRALAPK